MKTLVLIFCGLAVAAATPEWEAFKTTYTKSYANAIEEVYRMGVFLEKVKYIEEFNKLYEKGEKSYFLRINKYSDLTHEELLAQMTGGFKRRVEPPTEPPKEVSLEGVAESVDWRTKGAVTPVKDQGECRSDWAFSVVASLESMHFLKTGELVGLSEQNLVDCTFGYGNYGCQGGRSLLAFWYIRDNDGIDTESSYPYHGVTQKCFYDPSNIGATMSSYVEPTAGSESALQKAVHDVGPVSVCVDATQPSFGSYGGGVYYEPNCDTVYGNLYVATVGYGTEGDYEYWLLKNSWGTSWGESGYMKMAKNQGNMCAISMYSIYPVV